MGVGKRVKTKSCVKRHMEIWGQELDRVLELEPCI
jgi:hypothetical protein